MKKQTKHLWALVLAVATVTSMAVLAAEKIELTESIKVPDNSHIHINVPVGQVKLITKQTDQVDLNIIVKQKNGGWFDSSDITQAKLDKEIRGNQLFLSVDIEDSKQDWVVTVPVDSSLKLNIGVGTVDLRNISKNLDVNVGVGEADIKLGDDNYQLIKLSTGVGDAELTGLERVKTKRNMVSKTVSWGGNGKHSINVEVGVGDIEVDY